MKTLLYIPLLIIVISCDNDPDIDNKQAEFTASLTDNFAVTDLHGSKWYLIYENGSLVTPFIQFYGTDSIVETYQDKDTIVELAPYGGCDILSNDSILLGYGPRDSFDYFRDTLNPGICEKLSRQRHQIRMTKGKDTVYIMSLIEGGFREYMTKNR